MKALLIGRFQPFHKGHLKIIKKILTECDELSIVIGSSQYENTRENPFSADERAKMIEMSLDDEEITRYQVFKVPDINNDDLYPGHVMKMVPSFDVIYSGNALVQRLFSAAGKKVRKIELIRGNVYSGREIRNRIVKGKKWTHLVPKKVLEYLGDIRGAERIRKLARS